ncbi:MAG TPA: lipopolysaccharide heptosyltransferase II [Parachlamydiaceae bacterium]|nr:lipopolysaccharide heptosyltransferase II [Parachlamydiaceae bacterium]
MVVRMPNWIGDAVMATPVLKDLKSHFKHAKITAMCQPNIALLLKNCPYIDDTLIYKKPSGWIHRGTHLEIGDELKRAKFDLGLLLTNSFSSAWLFFSGNVKNRIGYRGNLRSFLLTNAVPLPKDLEKQHLVTTYKMLLEPLGIAVSKNLPELFVDEEESLSALNLLKTLGIDPRKNTIIGINPGAAYGSAKCWLPERFKALNKRLLEDPNVYLLYFGDQAGIPLVNDICQGMNERVINLAGKTTLRSLMALIQKCSVLVTNDSGPMHIASALGTKLLALFGSTSDIKTGPFGNSKVIHKHADCSPCYKRVCPIDFRCMTAISVNEVCQEIYKLLKN